MALENKTPCTIRVQSGLYLEATDNCHCFAETVFRSQITVRQENI